MKLTTKILFFNFLFLLGSMRALAQDSFSSYERAGLHPITYNKPAVDFFEGALLGNGAMGVVVTTRPDAVVFYFGHNNVWDIRLAENNKEKIGTFRDVFNRAKSIPDTLKDISQDKWYGEYSKMAGENYRKPYPRPFPCGSVLLGFDRRNAEMIGHRLDISNGLCEVYLLTKDQKKITLQIFTDMTKDQLWFRLVDHQGNLCENIFDRVKVMPDPSTPKEFPKTKIEEELSKGILSFRQTLPYLEPDKYDMVKGHSKDKAFRLITALNCSLEKSSRFKEGNKVEMINLEAGISKKTVFVGCVTLQEGLNRDIAIALPETEVLQTERYQTSILKSQQIWKEYWNKSGVKLSDQFLERIWYHNLYFLNCATKREATTPGLFANWSYNTIGTAWHGDYHMNYNTQQPFWVTYSSNHLEKNLPYVNLIEQLMPVSKGWAKEYYEMPGAYFPHSAYPVDMSMNPYPVPDWGWEVFETPWAVQGLWWHYLYSADTEFLRTRAYEPIKAAVEFLVAYMKRPEANGAQWKDDKFHIFPTIPPELYALRPGFKYNYDGHLDLTLTKFIFKAFIEAARVLKLENKEKALLSDVGLIMSRFPVYPTATSNAFGKVLVSVSDERPDVVYNLPVPLVSVFPGEDFGLHSDLETKLMLKNSYLNQQNEGGNDLVLINLQAARIDMLDLEKFKRQVNYCLLPNGTASDRVMQVHGRYHDLWAYDWMDICGVWFENFALPVVINECLMQSYTGTIRLFPNWPMDKDAEFHTLRAAGAFLVSASLKNGQVGKIEIFSEAGGLLKIILPWKSGGSAANASGTKMLKSNVVEMQTKKGETIIFKP